MRWLVLLLLFAPGLAFAQAQPHIVMILGDDALRGHIGQFRTDGVDTTWSVGDGDTATPNLDLIAQNGVMVDHFVTSQMCTNSRASALGFGHAYMATHLMGKVQTMDGDKDTDGFQDVTHTTEVNPYIKTVVNYAQDLGYEVVFIGKWHLSRLSWVQKTRYEMDTPGASETSMLKAMGFDRAIYTIGNPMQPSYLSQDGTLSVDAQMQLGHNNFVVCTLAGVDCVVEITNHSTVYFMDALQADITTHTNKKTLYFFWPNAAHTPYNWGQANSCGSPQDEACDDRVAGSSCTDADCVFEEFITNLDSEIGDLMADMNSGAGLLCTNLFDEAATPQTTGSPDDLCDSGREPIKDTILFTWDNGIAQDPTSPNECEVSAGRKQSPFPCGVINGLVTAGAAVRNGFTPVTGHITGLHEMADLPKTLEQMMGGTGKGLTSAGSSFMDCLDGTVSLASCPSTDFVPYVEWAPLGSAKTKGQMPNRMPDCATDADADWDELEMGGWTYEFNGRYLLHRIYSMAGNCDYTEQLYDTDGDTDRYVVLDSTQPIADSGAAAAANSIDCAISGADWAVGYTEDADDESACNLLHARLDPIMASLGKPKISFGGGAF